MEKKETTLKITPTQQMISSCTGAFITALFVTPLDVVKIRLQAQQKEFMKHKCFLYCNGLMDHLCYCVNGNGNGQIQSAIKPNPRWFRRPGHFNGTIDAFIKIARNEGISSLWSGLPPTLVMAVPATVIYFTIYDQLCDRMRKRAPQHQKSIVIPMLSGAMARVVACTIISPLEFVRTKMQSKRLSYLEIVHAVKSLVHHNGFFSLWRGLGPTILRDVPFSAIYWANYEFFKQRFNQETPTFWFSFGAGAGAGTVAAILTLPFDVVKTHRQIELGELELKKEKSKQMSSTTHNLQKIYQARGIPGLFAGIVPRIVKVAPACAIMISTYEFGKAFFRSYNAKIKSNRSKESSNQ